MAGGPAFAHAVSVPVSTRRLISAVILCWWMVRRSGQPQQFPLTDAGWNAPRFAEQLSADLQIARRIPEHEIEAEAIAPIQHLQRAGLCVSHLTRTSARACCLVLPRL